MKKSVAKASRVDSEKLLSLMFEMGRVIRQACVKSGSADLALSSVETLRFIAEADAPTMRDVARYLRITAPSATALVEGLVREGFISRKADASDRRKVLLSVSAKGRKTLAETMRTKREAIRSVLAGLSASDTRELSRILGSVIKSY